MIRRAAVTLLIAVALAGFAGQAQAKRVLDEKLDMATLQKMAASGQLIHLEYKGNTLVNRMVCVLVKAPPAKVWAVITDFGNYHKFVPEMLPPKVTKISATEYKVDFTLDIKILGPVKTTQKYSMLYSLENPYLYMYDPAAAKGPKASASYWKVVPVSGGKQTMLFYLDAAPDLGKMGSLVVNVVKEKPELALALQVSPVSIMVQEIKKYAEGKK